MSRVITLEAYYEYHALNRVHLFGVSQQQCLEHVLNLGRVVQQVLLAREDFYGVQLQQLDQGSEEDTAFGFKVRCLFKMDYAEAEYISQLRSGVKGHLSYRTIAWLMKQKITEQYPYLGELIHATPPDVEDPLKR